MKKAMLFTGQGFQFEGMLHKLPNSKITKLCIEEASEHLKIDVLSLDTNEQLKSSLSVQICIYISEIILQRLFVESNSVDYVAGHSIGAFSAAVTSGALDFLEGLDLVYLRGSKMQNICKAGFGMLSIIGLNYKLISNLLENFHNEYKKIEILDKAYIANINNDYQTVLSGKNEVLAQAESYIKKFYQVKTSKLRVSVPSHCIIMKPVSEALEENLTSIKMNQAKIPYIMNSTARRTKNSEEIKFDLINGVSRTVQWNNIMNLLIELDVKLCIEASQANVLCKLGEDIYSHIKWLSIKQYSLSDINKIIEKYIWYYN